MQNYVVFQAYGHPPILLEAIYAILSLHRFSASHDYQIVIYTDNKAIFQQYLGEISIIYELVDSNLIKEWRGEKDFVHRFKIKMLQDFFAKYNGNLLYVDTDIVFKKPINNIFAEISEGQLFMHLAEGIIDQQKGSLAKKISRFLRNNEFNVGTEKKLKISSSTVMWNAGVIGMNSKDKGLLDKVLLLSDDMYGKYQKHVMEQLAFSYCLQNYKTVKPTDNLIYHYWFFKEFRTVLKQFFEVNKQRTVEQIVEQIDTINPEDLVIPKKNYEAMPKWKRWWWKIQRKTWEMPHIQFK